MNSSRWTVCAVALLLAGCGSSPPVPEDRFYQLELAAPATSLPSPVLQGGLTIERVNTDPMRSGRAILYRDTGKPLELRRYHYQFWVDAPPQMIQQALLSYLADSGVADRVQSGASRRDTDYSLQTRLIRFEQLVGTAPGGFEVEIEIALYSQRSGTLLLSKVYRQRQNAREGDMHSVARAMQAALDSIFHSLAADIGSVSSRL